MTKITEFPKSASAPKLQARFGCKQRNARSDTGAAYGSAASTCGGEKLVSTARSRLPLSAVRSGAYLLKSQFQRTTTEKREKPTHLTETPNKTLLVCTAKPKCASSLAGLFHETGGGGGDRCILGLALTGPLQTTEIDADRHA